MNLGQFYKAATSLRMRLKTHQLPSLLNQLTQLYHAVANNPADGASQANITKVLTQIYDATRNGALDRQSREEKEILIHLDAAFYLEGWLENELEEIINPNKLDIAETARLLRLVSNKSSSAIKKIDSICESLDAYIVEDDISGPGEVELYVVIPRRLNVSALEFSDDVKLLSQLGRCVSEIVGLGVQDPKVKLLSSSDFGVFLEWLPSAAGFFAVAVERSLAAYKKILEIQMMRSELQKKSVPDEALKEIDKYIKATIEVEVQTAVESVVKERAKIDDEARRNELQNAIGKQINALIKKQIKGYEVGVRAAPLNGNDAQNKESVDLAIQLEEINNINSLIQKQRLSKGEVQIMLELFEDSARTDPSSNGQ